MKVLLQSKSVLLSAVFVTLSGTISFAQDAPLNPAGAAPPAPVTEESAPVSSEPAARTRAKSTKRGVRVREKEAEGTQAPNRFETDILIHSKYKQDGKPLQVDPD